MEEQLTEEQISEFRKAFALFDRDGDGTVSAKELGEVMKVLGYTLTEPELLELMRKETENDKSESIDFPEFLSLMAKMLKDVDDEEELLAAFRVFDKDRTGKVSVAELRHEMTKLELKDDEIDELIKEVDIFGDGNVNYEEMVKILMGTGAKA